MAPIAQPRIADAAMLAGFQITIEIASTIIPVAMARRLIGR